MKLKYISKDGYCKEYMRYLGVAKTERRSFAESVRLLEARGFREISTFKALKPGDRVYRGREDRTVMAAVIGRRSIAEAGLKVVGSRIGGGCPWGKDPTKADVTLNVYARRKALEGMRRYGHPSMQCMISCCIGKRDIRVTLLDGENRIVETYTESNPASHVIESLGLDKPVYAEMCRNGLFGYEGRD